MARKKVTPASLANLSKGNLLRAQVYDPDKSHAKDAFDKLDPDQQLLALQGKDERHFKNYDTLDFSSAMNVERSKWLESRHKGLIKSATKSDIMDDFSKMRMLYRDGSERPKRSVRDGALGEDSEERSGETPIESNEPATDEMDVEMVEFRDRSSDGDYGKKSPRRSKRKS